MAPIVYARPNTVGKFTDLPLVMWYEVVPTPRGRQYRYSVIFSNEDGGTQTDRLMATWGRTTDIEFVYGVELDEARSDPRGRISGPRARSAGVSRAGTRRGIRCCGCRPTTTWSANPGPTAIRYAPVPTRFDLSVDAREAVMDAAPWTYAIASAEMRREGKIAEDPPPGLNKIRRPATFRPRRSLRHRRQRRPGSRSRHVRSAVSVAQSALTWTPSDRGLPQYRIVRDGCFTIATPLPAGTRSSDIRAIRVHAFERPPAEGKPRVAADPVTFTRINKVFMLDEHDLPGPSILKWEGSQTIRAGGEPFEIRIP